MVSAPLLLLALLALLAPPAPPIRVVPLRITIAQGPAGPVAPTTFVDAQVRAANEIFAPHRLRFDAVVRAAPGTTEVVSRADRDAWISQVGASAKGSIEVFVVARLMDVDEPGRVRRGVHWRERKRGRSTGRRGILLAAYAGPSILAHELGHALGHPGHTELEDDLMSYRRTGTRLPTLRPAIGRLMYGTARAAGARPEALDAARAHP